MGSSSISHSSQAKQPDDDDSTVLFGLSGAALGDASGSATQMIDLHVKFPHQLMLNPEFNSAFAQFAAQLAKALNKPMAIPAPPALPQPPAVATPPTPPPAAAPAHFGVQPPQHNGSLIAHPMWPPGLSHISQSPLYNSLNAAQQIIMYTREWYKVQDKFNHGPKDWSIPGIEIQDTYETSISSRPAEQYLAKFLLWQGDELFHLTSKPAPAVRNVKYFNPAEDKVPFPPFHATPLQLFGLFEIVTARMPENALLAVVDRCFKNSTMPMYERYAALLSLKYFEADLRDTPRRPHQLRRFFSPPWWAEVVKCGITMMFEHAFHPETLWLNPAPVKIKIRNFNGGVYKLFCRCPVVGEDNLNDLESRVPISTITLPELNLREARKLFWKFFTESYLCGDKHLNPLQVGTLCISKQTAQQYYEAHQQSMGNITQAIHNMGLADVMNVPARKRGRTDLALDKALLAPQVYTHLYHSIRVSLGQALGGVNIMQCLMDMSNWLKAGMAQKWLNANVADKMKPVTLKKTPGLRIEQLSDVDAHCTQLMELYSAINNQPNTTENHWHQTLPVLWAYATQRASSGAPHTAQPLQRSLCMVVLQQADTLLNNPTQVDQTKLFNAMMQALCDTHDATLLNPLNTLKAFTKHVADVLQRHEAETPRRFEEEDQFKLRAGEPEGDFYRSARGRPTMELMGHYVCGLGNTPDSIYAYIYAAAENPIDGKANDYAYDKAMFYRRQRERSMAGQSPDDYMSDEMAQQFKTCKTLGEVPSIPPGGIQFTRQGTSAAELLLQNPNLSPEMLEKGILNGVWLGCDDAWRRIGCGNLNTVLNKNLPYRPHPIEARLRALFAAQESIQIDFEKA